ncbi:MAG TPA: MFS transporter [Dermatophilaceae bacterium]|nr:MFS transporter [Dermatophilaceae bacterium]
MTGTVARLLAAHGFGAVAMGVAWPMLLVEAEHAGASGLGLGLVAACRLLPYVVLSWLAGRLADRRERARIVRISLVCRGLALVACAAAITVGSFWLALVAAVAAVVAGTPAYPAVAAGLPGLIGPDPAALARATRLLVTIEVAAFVVGPAIGGLLILAPVDATPLIGALLAVVGVALVGRIELPAPLPRVAGAERIALRHMLARTPVAARALSSLVAVNVVIGGLGILLLPLAQQWNVGQGGFGTATAVLGFASVAAPLLGRLCTGQRSALLALAGSIGVVACSGWPVALVGLVIAGMVSVRAEGAATVALQQSVPDDSRASVLGLGDSLMVAAALVASIGAPWLAEPVGATGAGLAGALVALGAAAVASGSIAQPQLSSMPASASRSARVTVRR